MTTWEDTYLHLVRHILDNGEDRQDRTGTGTRAIFGASLDIDLGQGFPIMTTKKVSFKSVASELLWFIEGSGDERRLAQILHDTRDADKKTIWSANAQSTTGSRFSPRFQGDLGRVYGVQWRDWTSSEVLQYDDYLNHDDTTTTYFGAKVQQTKVDQLAEVVRLLRTDPTSRRIILSAWNPGELHRMALPPCHILAQFYLSNDNHLSCQMYQRSIDVGLGLPYNITSYALLTHILAHSIGASVGHLRMVLGDTHIYLDHIDALREQATRTPSSAPTLLIKTDRLEFDGYQLGDFELIGYNPASSIAMRMSA